MALTADKRHQFDRDQFYGDFALNAGWQQNYGRSKLATYFMDKCGSMTVGANNAGNDVRASDLGLSESYTGCAKLCPKYQDFVLDFDTYLGWDGFVQGMWTELRVPFVHTRWNAGLTTCTQSEGGEYYTFGVRDQYVNRIACNPERVVYTGGCALSQALEGNLPFGDAPALDAGRINSCTHTSSGLADVRFTLGYDFVRLERGSLGIALDIMFPAANKLAKNTCCQPLYIFDASVGAQHAWKVGGVLRGQYRLWHNDANRRLDLFLDARAHGVMHGETTRLLGLNVGGTTLFNQYLLLKEYDCQNTQAEYVGLERAANLLKARVTYCKPLVEGQFTAMLQCTRGNFVGAIGYNFFGRSAENLKVKCFCQTPAAQHYYVIKGVWPVQFEDGENISEGGFCDPKLSNIGSAPTAAVLGSQEAEGSIASSLVKESAVNFSTGTCTNLSLCPASHPGYVCNTLFVDLGHNWHDKDWTPYLGVIGKVDFGSKNTALRLWGVYLKGGFCF